MPSLTVLDAYTSNPGDLSWSEFDAIASCTYHDRSARDEVIGRARNCFITPHIGWATREARARLISTAPANARAFLAGSPQNVVR